MIETLEELKLISLSLEYLIFLSLFDLIGLRITFYFIRVIKSILNGMMTQFPYQASFFPC